ncbi:hypothetical protein AVEN_138463-1 [Araneus ventricosus]|uniref:Uncharacterized protein n=1 Tax=Araneus ventricosus TaxID=182803 RepID=A0A4Y2CDD6_ARAVE|nr:hypothetical protein AVEN_138463-1 [Araneus ventricosus]
MIHPLTLVLPSERGRSDLVVRSRHRTAGFQVRKPIPLKIHRVLGLFHAKSYIVGQTSPAVVVRKFGEGLPAQASSSSSDRDLNYEIRPK